MHTASSSLFADIDPARFLIVNDDFAKCPPGEDPYVRSWRARRTQTAWGRGSVVLGHDVEPFRPELPHGVVPRNAHVNDAAFRPLEVRGTELRIWVAGVVLHGQLATRDPALRDTLDR